MGGRPSRGRAGSGRLLWQLLFGRSLAVGEGWLGEGWLGAGLGPKEKLGRGKKKAQNGIKTKDKSTTTSAGSKKKKKLFSVLLVIQIPRIPNRRPKKRKKHKDKQLTTQPNDNTRSRYVYSTSIWRYISPGFILRTEYTSLKYDSETYES